jgi:hypothetical protein
LYLVAGLIQQEDQEQQQRQRAQESRRAAAALAPTENLLNLSPEMRAFKEKMEANGAGRGFPPAPTADQKAAEAVRVRAKFDRDFNDNATYKIDTIRMTAKDPTTKVVMCAADLTVAVNAWTVKLPITYKIENTSDGRLYATVFSDTPPPSEAYIPSSRPARNPFDDNSGRARRPFQ